MSHDATSPVPRAKRIALLVWGVACYALFFACFLYAIAFVGNLAIAPKTIDSGDPGPIGLALAVDLGLLSLFAVQHSGMARPAFKRAWKKFVPEAAERPTYVLLSTLALVVVFALWQPIGGVVWAVTNEVGAETLRALYFAGWGMLLYATALIDHFDLFGIARRGSASAAGPTRHIRSRLPASIGTCAIRSTCRGPSSSGRPR